MIVKAIGRYMVITGILVVLILLGGIAGRLLLLLGGLALRLFLGSCTVMAICAVGRFIKVALTTPSRQVRKVHE